MNELNEMLKFQKTADFGFHLSLSLSFISLKLAMVAVGHVNKIR